MSEYFHSVILDKNKCKGCTNCIKRCPTEAIRVRNGKASIINERCIDCGECIRVCPHSAKMAKTDDFDKIFDYEYKVALPAPSLYGQFKKTLDIGRILSSLVEIGFDDVFEVATAADIVTKATKEFLNNYNGIKPVICSACPVCIRLIKIRFPELIDNILPLLSPMDVAAKLAREEAVKKTGLSPEKIGVFFITPCAAKATAIKSPLGVDKTEIDGAISIKSIYPKIVNLLSSGETAKITPLSSPYGVGWATGGGENAALDIEKSISVDGINNVISILEQIDNDRITDIDFVEVNACVGGCVGGPLTVENNFIAKTKIKKIKNLLKQNTKDDNSVVLPDIDVSFNKPIEFSSIMQLDNDISEAIRKMDSIRAIANELPGLDCGSCGAPSCHALAEDIVLGFGSEGDCIFKLKERIQVLAHEILELEEHMPPPFRNEIEKEEEHKNDN